MPPTDGACRPLEPADLARVLELEPVLFGREAWTRGMYREELASPTRAYRAIDDGGRLVAWGGVLLGETAQILTLGVDPDHQRRGLGSRLLRDLLAIAADHGAREVLLEVRASDDGAQRLYLRHGFLPIGRRRNYYQLIGEDAVVMRRVIAGPPPQDEQAGPKDSVGP